MPPQSSDVEIVDIDPRITPFKSTFSFFKPQIAQDDPFRHALVLYESWRPNFIGIIGINNIWASTISAITVPSIRNSQFKISLFPDHSLQTSLPDRIKYLAELDPRLKPWKRKLTTLLFEVDAISDLMAEQSRTFLSLQNVIIIALTSKEILSVSKRRDVLAKANICLKRVKKKRVSSFVSD